MSTQTTETKPETKSRRASARTAIHGVTFQQYLTIRNHPGNDRLRLTYHNGTLEIMSPQSAHEHPSYLLGLLIFLICQEFGIHFTGAGSTTFSKKGEKKNDGFGKEPDECFYFANYAAILDKQGDMRIDKGDLLPDLWIEIDNRPSSAGKLPLYAALGVPELWRYRTKTGKAWFGKLVNRKYIPIDHSLSLPVLTPGHVEDMLAMGKNVSITAWATHLKPYMAEHLKPLS